MDTSVLHIRSSNPTGRPRIAVVGGGVAGMATAAFLNRDRRRDVILYERQPHFGGRAGVTATGAEHCARLLLPDYHAIWSLLREIPAENGDGTVFDTVTRVRRMEWGPGGRWIELDHINRFRASGLSWRDQVAMIRQGPPRTLIAQTHDANENAFGTWRQYSVASLFGILRNIWRTDRLFAFPGSTERYLISPMRANLEHSGVLLLPDHEIRQIALGAEGFDAVVLALFPTDLAPLLDASGLRHGLDLSLRHAHCKVLTIELDRREPVLNSAKPALFCRAGLAILLQPKESRCVVVCTRVASTDDDYVLALIGELLLLRHDFSAVHSRTNLLPHEGVWSATMPTTAKVLPDPPRGVHLAGSWLASGYPYDSAESAVRSAWKAAEAVIRETR